VTATRSVSIHGQIRQTRDLLEPTGLARTRTIKFEKKSMLDPIRFGPFPTRPTCANPPPTRPDPTRETRANPTQYLINSEIKKNRKNSKKNAEKLKNFAQNINSYIFLISLIIIFEFFEIFENLFEFYWVVFEFWKKKNPPICPVSDLI
jgi:hypothetical protein